MKINLYIFIYIILFFLPIPLHAIDVSFSQISSDSGLSQNTIITIAEDKNGFIWAGTLDGLNRYDGYNIRSYQPQLGNPNVLDDHRIKELYVDRDGYMWAKTYRNERSCYDPVSDSFVHVKDNDGKHLTHFQHYESSRGEMWLWGKYDGLARIQKDNMPTFKLDKLLSKFPRGEACHFLFEDSDATIWIGGEFGLYKIVDDKIKTIECPGKQQFVYTQAAEVNGKIYFSTQESVLVVYDTASKHIEIIPYSEKDPFLNIACLSEKELVIVMKSLDILLFDTETSQFRRSSINNEADFANELRNEVRIYVDKNKKVWFYNNSGVIWYYDREVKKFQKLPLIPKEIAGTIDIIQIFVDSDNLVWIITYGYGLFCYDAATDKLTNYRYESVSNSLPSNYLINIIEDRFGTLWIGSEYAGIIRVVKTPGYIRTVRPEVNTIIGKTNNVRTICKDSQNNIWIGTKNGGLYIYDSDLTKGRCIAENINPYSLVEDDKGRMWIGTKWYGIYLYDIKTLRMIKHINHDPNDPASLSHNIIFHLMKDNKNRIWAGSFAGGINLIEEHGNKFTCKRFIQDEEDKSLVRYLFQDSKDRIWVGSNGGLIRFNPDELIKNPMAYTFYEKDAGMKHPLSSNDIKIIYEDRDHTIWIGTAGGGLNLFMEATDDEPEHFISYSATHGMADNFVLGILEHEDDLWISGENGLSRFARKEESFTTYQFAQRAFGNIFSEGAFWKTENDEMLWGTLDGLLVFKPNKFVPDTSPRPILLTQLTVDRTDWNDLEGKSSNKSITYTDKIELSYKQNTFSLEFAMMNLKNPAENKYSYILENYDKEWSIPTLSNTATYKNLPHGKYTFKVKGVNTNEIRNNATTTLLIVITPPFWQSPLAYLIYLILLVSVLYITFRLMMKFNRLNNEVEVEKQLSNHKLRFFTNISHEFRTPLTLIQGAVENLNEQIGLPAPASRQVNILNRNSIILRRLIDQLLEFRKLQNDVLTLDLEEVDIVTFTQDIFNGFQELAARKNIQFVFHSPTEHLYIYIDRKKIDKVLYNLLSNAFKFTPKDGFIELELTYNETEQLCSLSIKDNGVGVPKDKQYLLFSRFTQIHASASGTGIGLSMVKEFVDAHKGKISYEGNPGGGSIFMVELSTSKKTYEGENFITNIYPDIIQDNHTNLSLHEEKNMYIDSKTLADYQLLIIDDNDDILTFLTEGFRKYLKVDTASDGKEGLEKAIEMNPDLIICDVMMPEMDGFEITRHLKNEFQTCHIPIILLTAHSSMEHQLEGIESGADAYITKPFSMKYIVKRVMKLIEQRERLKKRFSKEFVIDGNLIKTTNKDKAFLDRIEKILEDNYQDSNFTVDRFVELSGTRRTIFFKKVKGITGFPPNELLKIKRLSKGAALLKQDKLTVSEIAYQIGFEDPNYFSKCFKIQFNCTPTEYKNKTYDESVK